MKKFFSPLFLLLAIVWWIPSASASTLAWDHDDPQYPLGQGLEFWVQVSANPTGPWFPAGTTPELSILLASLSIPPESPSNLYLTVAAHGTETGLTSELPAAILWSRFPGAGGGDDDPDNNPDPTFTPGPGVGPGDGPGTEEPDDSAGSKSIMSRLASNPMNIYLLHGRKVTDLSAQTLQIGAVQPDQLVFASSILEDGPFNRQSALSQNRQGVQVASISKSADGKLTINGTETGITVPEGRVQTLLAGRQIGVVAGKQVLMANLNSTEVYRGVFPDAVAFGVMVGRINYPYLLQEDSINTKKARREARLLARSLPEESQREFLTQARKIKALAFSRLVMTDGEKIEAKQVRRVTPILPMARVAFTTAYSVDKKNILVITASLKGDISSSFGEGFKLDVRSNERVRTITSVDGSNGGIFAAEVKARGSQSQPYIALLAPETKETISLGGNAGTAGGSEPVTALLLTQEYRGKIR